MAALADPRIGSGGGKPHPVSRFKYKVRSFSRVLSQEPKSCFTCWSSAHRTALVLRCISVTISGSQLVFLGDATVGKTSILTRFIYDSFGTDYKVSDHLCMSAFSSSQGEGV